MTAKVIPVSNTITTVIARRRRSQEGNRGNSNFPKRFIGIALGING